jgi:hypothetical protein
MAQSKSFKKAKRPLRGASRPRIEDAVRTRTKRSCAKGRWLVKTNRYSRNAIQKFESDVGTGGTVNVPHFHEYVAGSAPTHLIDGWSYVARACEALLRGDQPAAVHLAYYAELRAAMSLLAGGGIAVMKGPHAIVDSAGAVVKVFGGGTHAFVWPALEWWSRPKSVRVALLSYLAVSGHRLDQWLTEFQSGTSAAAISAEWLSTWCMDLRRMSLDHDARNEVSYRPSQFRTRSAVQADRAVAFVTELWRLFEPAGAGKFEVLDRLLLRHAFEKAFFGIHGVSATDRPTEFHASVDGALSRLDVPSGERPAMAQFLTRNVVPHDPDPIRYAITLGASDEGDVAMQIIARAALLLRLASGSTNAMFRAAGIGTDDLAFWWKRFGTERGLWTSAAAPYAVTDVWADVEGGIAAADSWRAAAGPHEYRNLRTSVGSFIGDITSFEVLSCWGLAS